MWALVSAPTGPDKMICPVGSTVRGWQLAQSAFVIVGKWGSKVGGRPWQA